MLKKMILHTLLAAFVIGTLAITYQASAYEPVSLAGFWAVSAEYDD